MKRVITLLLICSVALFAAIAPQTNDIKVKEARKTATIRPDTRIEISSNEESVKALTGPMNAPALLVDTTAVTTVYFEDFENGDNGWTQFDGTAPDPNGAFVLTDELSVGDSSWWCGATLGGYRSHWHVALETPAVELTGADSILSFDVEVYAEGPGGEPEGYDGWDGANVQISNDGGETWTVLQPDGVPYNCTSLYSFGYEFNMGPGIAGWGGTQFGEATVNLAEYLGDTVMVRFVFASDPSYDGSDDASLLGMFVDSIDVAGNATYNGTVEDGLVSYAVNSASGAFWSVYETTDSIPSPTHVLRNYDPADTTFAVGLEDYYVSPSITLPDETNTLIFCNFEFLADFADEVGEFPDVDFWRLEVSPDDGTTWNAISNPTGNPTGDNFVYNQQIPVWYDFQYAYDERCELTDFAGQTVKFRFYFHSDLDQPAGKGLMVDDFIVYSQPDLPIPTGLAASLNASANVELTWDDMNGTYQQPKSFMATTPASETIGAYYGMSDTFFGDDSVAGYTACQSYNTNGKDFNVTGIDYALFPVNPLNDEVSLQLYGVDSLIHELYASSSFVPDTVDHIVSMDISSEEIVVNGEFWVGLTWETNPSFPTWYLDDGAGLKLMTPGGDVYNAAYSTPFGLTGYGEVTYSGLTYNVYRREAAVSTYDLIAEGVDGTTYTDETASPMIEYVYAVVSTQDDFESDMGETASVFVIPTDYEEIAHDDGSMDDYMELGMDSMVVVKVTPSSYPSKLEAVRFGAAWAGDMYKVEIFADEGGVPGSSLLKIEPEVTALEGWNTFNLINNLTVGDDGVVVEEGSIWVGVKGNTPGAYPAWFGMDTDGDLAGMATFQAPGGSWTSLVPVKRGNPLIRAYLDTDIDTTYISDVPADYALAQNYPNPFNPVTTIHFDLKNSGETTLDVYDITGRHVRTLVNSSLNAGSYDLRFNAAALPSGIYFYKLTSGEFISIKKMSLIK